MKRWLLPTLFAGLCLVVFPIWILGIPGVSGSTYAMGWERGLKVIFYYPPALVILFGAHFLHSKLVTADSAREMVRNGYSVVAHLTLAIALITMATAWRLILT
jgi:hypothetical protein